MPKFKPKARGTSRSKEVTKEDKETVVATLAANLPAMPPSAEVPADNHLALAAVDPWSGLTEQQKVVQTLFLQGASQKVIGLTIGVSQPRVHGILKEIREVHKANGATIEAEAYVGETRSLFQTIEQQGWKILRKAEAANNTAVQIQALQMIKSARLDQTKMLLDIGMLDKAADRVEHSVTVNKSIVDDWTPVQRQLAAKAIIESQLTPLEAPTPPEPDYEDAEFEENK